MPGRIKRHGGQPRFCIELECLEERQLLSLAGTLMPALPLSATGAADLAPALLAPPTPVLTVEQNTASLLPTVASSSLTRPAILGQPLSFLQPLASDVLSGKVVAATESLSATTALSGTLTAAPLTGVLTQPITQTVAAAITPLTNLTQSIVAPLMSSVAAPLTQPVSQIVAAVGTPLFALTETVTPLVSSVLTPLTNAVVPVVDDVLAPVTNVLASVAADAASVVSPIATVLIPVLDTATVTLAGAVSAVLPAAGQVTGTVAAAVPPVVSLTQPWVVPPQHARGETGSPLLPDSGSLTTPAGQFPNPLPQTAAENLTSSGTVAAVPPQSSTPLLALLTQTSFQWSLFPSLRTPLPNIVLGDTETLAVNAALHASDFAGMDDNALWAGILGASGLVEQEAETPAEGTVVNEELAAMELLILPDEVEEAGVLDLSALEMAGLAAVAAPITVAALAQVLEDFLAEAARTYRTLLGWLERLGPWPWLLMSLAAVAALQQYARWRLRQAREQQLAWSAEHLI